jgi:hypothetical protein
MTDSRLDITGTVPNRRAVLDEHSGVPLYVQLLADFEASTPMGEWSPEAMKCAINLIHDDSCAFAPTSRPPERGMKTSLVQCASSGGCREPADE